MQSNIANKSKPMHFTRMVLSHNTISAIKKDASLYGLLATHLGVSISSMPRILKNNTRLSQASLTQPSVLRILRDHLGQDDSSLLSEEFQGDKPKTTFLN